MARLFSGIWSYVLAAVAFVGLVGFWALQLIATGRKAERADQLQRNAKAQERINDADARGPRTAGDVDKRLSDGSF